MDMKYWGLKNFEPRPEQIKIINEVSSAWDNDYDNVIIEAGTGVGKSAIATTLARMVQDSYILTMTTQLQEQYLNDFNKYLVEIKGKKNYPCNYGGYCNECNKEEMISPNGKPLPKCEDCEYRLAVKTAQHSKTVLTNYDYLWYAGNYANQWNTRELIIFDESHNFEKKIMSLITKTLNRWSIYQDYHFDIFYPIVNGETLESIKIPEYWEGVCEKLIEYEEQWLGLHGDESNLKQKNQHENRLKRYHEIIRYLNEEDWIIEVPNKSTILNDNSYREQGRHKGLKVEFKPLMINNYSKEIFKFGDKKLFLTGTLGNKQRFCHWNGLDQDSTLHIFMKSPFPVKNRPIIKDYVGNMSGFKNRIPNWQNAGALVKIREIVKKHSGEKGVIHTSSNQQAWWIKKNIGSKLFWVAYGENRAETISLFEKSNKPVVLLGAGIKDGVDFKGDKCRYQILFKMPKPSIASTQTIIRAKKDPTWYAYQTVMPLMQSYGRGIRDETDYCTTYVLDSEFDNLLTNYNNLFNEYFLEAIQ